MDDPNKADHSSEATLRGRDLISIGGLLVAGVVGGLVIGLLIDKAAGTEPVFSLLGVLLGIVAGGLGFWVRVRAALK